MATPEDFEFRAIGSESSKVVSAAKALKKKNRLSRKNQDKFGKLGPQNLDATLIRQKQDFVRKVEVPLLTKWGELSPPGISSVKGTGGQRKVLVFPPSPSSYPTSQQDEGAGYTSEAIFSTSEDGSGSCQDDDVEVQSESGEDGDDSDTCMSGNEAGNDETTLSVHVLTTAGGTSLPVPQTDSSSGALLPLPTLGLTGSPQPSTVSQRADCLTLPSPGTQITQVFSPTILQKGASLTVPQSGPPIQQLDNKPPQSDVPITDTEDSGEYFSPPTRIRDDKTMFVVPDTQTLSVSERPMEEGMISSTPSSLLPSAATDNICPVLLKHLQAFEAAFPNAWDRMRNLGRLMSAISEEYSQLSARLERVETALALRQVARMELSQPSVAPLPSQTAKPVSGMQDSLPPVALSQGRVAPKRRKQGSPPLSQPIERTDPLVTSQPVAEQILYSKAAAPPIVTHNLVVQAAPLGAPPRKSSPSVELHPRFNVPTLLIQPKTDDIVSSAQLKSLLETHIHPLTLGIKIVTCQPAALKGVIVRLWSPEMVNILENAVNTHPALKEVCEARLPRKRQPQIIIYDVPVASGDREVVEREFLQKLCSSNNFHAGSDMRIVCKKPGRGPYQHWVLGLAPGLYNCIKDCTRLYFGFGSFKFKEYLEPVRCYKCLKFGHLRAKCGAQSESCSRCLTNHSYRDCKADQPVCRNCVEFNTRNNRGFKLPTEHSAISDKCPVYIRVKKELGQRTAYST
ncbi:hypothetical protein AVEN_230754-1 [Araneus ventricosus]|uniref:CCHC-type domain-containing protein n=1 Tax=Araneus ventricosus TaxID=182803 RepID=A0A4Y2A1Y5_ARAVE|nr:hypothetical protein AVEN_230754-1 [Araneus ventricosus]